MEFLICQTDCPGRGDVNSCSFDSLENQFYLSLANRFSDKLSVGITAKFYYYKLFEEINTTSFGVDIGALYKIDDQFTVALAVIDINSKYK